MGIAMGMGMGTWIPGAGGAVNPPPPPPPPPDFLSLSTSIRSASSPGHTSGCPKKQWIVNTQRAELLPFTPNNQRFFTAYPDHGIRFIGHIIVLCDLYQIALDQDLGRSLHTQFVHQLKSDI